MGEDKSDKLPKNENRAVLGDITNQLGKRDSSLISPASPSSSSPASKSRGGTKRNADSDPDQTDSDVNFWKQVALVVENLEKERGSRAKFPKVANEAGLSPLQGGKIYRLQSPSTNAGSLPGTTGTGVETKEPSSSPTPHNIDLGQAQSLPNVVTTGDGVKGVCMPSVIVGESSNSSEANRLETRKESQGDEETRSLSDVAEVDCTQKHKVLAAAEAVTVRDDAKILCADYLTSGKSESVVSSRLTDSRDTKSFGLERCTGLKGNCGSSLGAGLDLLKSCSCSFCTTAAYIWSDLHYQDLKGRMSILSKSRKEASILAQRYSGENEMDRQGQENSSKDTHIETDLMGQWKSLFLFMENTFVSESSQAETNFHALKDIREEFKMNIEMMNGMPPDIQQCSSDASDHTIM